MSTSGRACIFLLPYGIHRTAGSISPRVIGFQGLTLRIYAPFVNSPVHSEPATLDFGRLPSPPGVDAAGPLLLRIRVDARPGWNVPFEVADAIRIDIYGDEEEMLLRESADRAARQFARLCRLWTRQWWILRGQSESREPLRNVFSVDGDGRVIAPEVSEILHVAPWLGTEQLLTDDTFRLICAALSLNADPSFACMGLLDAAAAANLGDRQRAVVDAAIACEALFSEQANALVRDGKIGATLARSVLNQEVKRRLRGGSRQLFGRAFADDHPAGWESLERLRVARHALAHGNPEQIARNAEINNQEAFAVAIRSAFDFFQWMANVRTRHFPDSLLAFERPLINNEA